MRKLLLRVLCWVTLGLLLFVAGLTIYGIRLRSSAKELINAAGDITSPAEVESQIAILRNRPGLVFWKDSAAPNGNETYEIRIENGYLHRLRVVPPTMLGVTIAIQNGEMHHLVVVMFSGAKANARSGVWVQEWFADSASKFHVNDNRKPWEATIDLSSGVPAPLRKKAFALNANCLVKPGGCKSAEEILQDVWRLEAPVSSRVPRAD